MRTATHGEIIKFNLLSQLMWYCMKRMEKICSYIFTLSLSLANCKIDCIFTQNFLSFFSFICIYARCHMSEFSMLNRQLMQRWQMELHNEIVRKGVQCVGRFTLYNVRWTWIWFSRCLQLCAGQGKTFQRQWWICRVDTECFMWIKWRYVLKVAWDTTHVERWKGWKAQTQCRATGWRCDELREKTHLNLYVMRLIDSIYF